MSVPTGIEREIYASPFKQSDVRVRIRLDRAKATADFVDEFGGASLDDTKFSSWIGANGSITVSGGKCNLTVIDDTNIFPGVQALPGISLPFDRTIPWTLEFTLDFPSITGFGCGFFVGDLKNEGAILLIWNDTADDYSIQMPEETEIENLGASHTTEHSYELIYTPATNIANATYELKRDSVSKGTIDATDRHAWQIGFGNYHVAHHEGSWTNISVSRVKVNLTGSVESQNFPPWTDRDTAYESGETWGRLPWLRSMQLSGHERNEIDQVILTLPQGGYITGISGDVQGRGYRANMLAGYDWIDREVRVETRQGDGRRWTTWKEVFRGYCNEPEVISEASEASLRITVGDKNSRLLQRAHIIRGYSDNAAAITGVQMNLDTSSIIEDLMQVAGLAAADYNVEAVTIKPRTWQVLGESALQAILELADDAVLATTRNAGSANPGRIEMATYDFGSGVPDYYLGQDEIIAIDWAETVMGMTAQSLVEVQHSEFSTFTEEYPDLPVPPYGAQIHRNARIAQTSADIDGSGGGSRRLHYLSYRMLNRELSSVVVSMVGQDWLEHNIELRALDRRVLNIAGEDYIAIGWEYLWTPEEGLRTNIHLVNQKPENTIMRSAIDQTITISY